MTRQTCAWWSGQLRPLFAAQQQKHEWPQKASLLIFGLAVMANLHKILTNKQANSPITQDLLGLGQIKSLLKVGNQDFSINIVTRLPGVRQRSKAPGNELGMGLWPWTSRRRNGCIRTHEAFH